jgi:prophage DNA circulation protein
VSDWRDRTRPIITLISPKKSTFNAKWRGDTRKITKKIGLFNFPKFNGTVAQDLGVDGTGYPLTFFFDGANADKESQRFESVTGEPGRWTIIHPTKGKLDLQPISFEISDNPVESGGVYQVSSEWIESVDLFSILSPQQLQAISKAQAVATNASSVEGFINNVSQVSVAAISAVSSTINNALAIITDPISALASGSADITGAIDSTIRGIQSQLTESVLDLTQISGSMQTLIQLPTQISTDFESRIETYKSMTAGLLDLTPKNVENILDGVFTTGVSEEDRNAVGAQEMILSAMLVALAQIVTTSEYKTRVQAVKAAEDISEQFKAITNELDRSQEAFKNEGINNQYFSQSKTFINSAKLTYQAVAYSIRSTFNLPVEKKITIENPVSAYRVSIEQYGQENIDENYQLFIDSNNLKDTEILMLPRGREVIIYV